MELFHKFISESVTLGLEEVGLYSTGEPFMTKDIEKYIALAKNLGVKRIYITTNGVLATLDKIIKCFNAGLNSIKFSINASNSSDYLKVHGYDDFNLVLRNVNEIYNWKINNNHPLQLLGSCVLIPGIKDTLKQHKEIFSKYFEDTEYVLSTSQGGQLFQLPFNEENKSLVFGNSEKTITEIPYQMPWNRAHLTAEGYMSACCVDYELDLVFGDINTNTFKDIWNNETIKNLRIKHLNDELSGLICDQCMNNYPAPFKPLSEVNKKMKSEEQRIIEQTKLLKRFIEIKKLP